MAIYWFVGSGKCTIVGYRILEHFGQRIDLPVELANGLVVGAGAEQANAGACALLPDDIFQQLGFDATELRMFAYPAQQRGDKAKDFLAKKQKALESLHEYRTGLEQSLSKPPAEILQAAHPEIEPELEPVIEPTKEPRDA